MILLIALSGLFVIAGIAQLIVLDLIRTRLSRYHPAQFAQLTERTRPNGMGSMAAAVARFAWRRQDKPLGDPRLSTLTGLCVGLYLAMVPGFAGLAFLIFSNMGH